MTTQQWLLLGKWIVFLGALTLAWAGHLPQSAENIVETMIFSLAGVHAASWIGMGKVSSLGDLVSRVTKLEVSAVSGDGTTPPVPVPAGNSNVSTLSPRG